MRELRQHASRWLARVAAGESFEITDRGRPVAVLAPVREPKGLAALEAAGAVLPATGSLWDAPIPAAGSPSANLSDAVRQMRDEDDR